MKKFISIFAVIMIILSMSVFAASADTVSAQNRQTGSEQRNKILQANKQAIADFRADASKKIDIVKANREDNKKLSNENTALRKELEAKLSSVKKAGTSLDKSIVTGLKVNIKELKRFLSEIKDTNGQIKGLPGANKSNFKDINYEALNLKYEKISEIQLNRNTKLIEINNLLKSTLQLLADF